MFRQFTVHLTKITIFGAQQNQERDTDIYRLLSRYASSGQKYEVLIQNCQRKVYRGFSASYPGFRLILMRIRFRASDFDRVATINIIGAKSKQASCAEMVLGSFVFPSVIQQTG